ncbi:MAG: hypothetical protein ACJ786_09220 [Catenulispora sp.]
MTKFADHLYENLMAEHGHALTAVPAASPAAAPAARRRLARPAWATAGTVAAAGTAALGFTVFGGAASAYAVTDNHDGTLTVKVSKPSGIDGANNELKHKGSHVVVIQAQDGCPSIQSFAVPGQGSVRGTVDIRSGGDGSPGSITVQDSGLPAGETELVAYKFDNGEVSVAMAVVKDPIPTCVSLPAPPPAGGGAVVDGSGGAAQTQVGSGSEPALNESRK